MPRPPKPTDHLDTIRHLMGTMPDHEVAEKCESTPSIVGRYRRKHGIPAYEGYKFGKGQSPPSKPADQPTRSKSPRRRRSKIDVYRDQVGQIPDQEIADLAGVSVEGVRMYRRRHGISLEGNARRRRGSASDAVASAAAPAPAAAPAAPTTPTPPPAAGGPAAAAAAAAATAATTSSDAVASSALDAFRDQLGSVPDSEIAAMADLSEAEVAAYRTAHGIAAPASVRRVRRTARAASAPAASAPASLPTTAEGLQGYAVTISGTEHIVLAADIAEAASSAVRARISGEITAIRHLGPALVCD